MTKPAKIGAAVVGVVVAVVVGIQAAPYERAELNPAKRIEPEWDSPRTRELAARACFDCHSNETKWPWYSRIAPFKWIVHHHVVEGRETLNFSEWDVTYDEADEVAEVIEEGEMPLWDYALIHPEAKLTDAEKDELAKGLEESLGLERW